MVATRRVSIDEFAEMPLEGTWELVDGEPIELTPAAGKSSRIGGRLYARLADHVEPNGLGWVFPAETGFVLFPDRTTVRSPDAAVVKRDRLPEPPDSFVPLAPDLAVEVLSPSDRMAAALAKIAMYSRRRRQPGLAHRPRVSDRHRLLSRHHPHKTHGW